MRKIIKIKWQNVVHPYYKTITANVYLKEHHKPIHIYRSNLLDTDGQIIGSSVKNFSYIVVQKSIPKIETPGFYHSEIKIYVTENFNGFTEENWRNLCRTTTEDYYIDCAIKKWIHS